MMHCEEDAAKDSGASATTTDRLTNLPESIIHHILSFLDIKSSVQTSVLSRPWRSLWKNVPVLNLNESSSPDSSSFYNFVNNVLSLRNRDLNLRKVTYENKGSYYDGSSTSELVFKYAVSNADEFSIDFGYRYYSRFLGLITNCNLKTLTLRNCLMKDPPDFQSLTSLILDNCSLCLQHNPDPFAKFPCLKYLVLYDCYIFHPLDHNYTLKVSGLQLLTLKLKVHSSDIKKIEINAPKLHSLYALFESAWIPEFTGVSLPSLVHATLFSDYDWFERLELDKLVSVFMLVRYVKFLRLNFTLVDALEKESNKFLQQWHSSPFIGLEKLIIEIPISDRLSNYFFKASRPTFAPVVSASPLVYSYSVPKNVAGTHYSGGQLLAPMIIGRV